MPLLSFIFFDILYLLTSFLIFIFIVTIIFYYTALVEMFSIYTYVTGREEWTPDSEQMFHHLLVVKTARCEKQ